MSAPPDVTEVFPTNFSATVSPLLRGHYAPVFDERTVHELKVVGDLPSGLRGAFLRNGPNPMFAPLGRYHLFDGDGMVHGVSFDGEGGASYANRWVRNAGLAAEMAAGCALFGGLSEFHLPPDDVFRTVGPIKNTGNTHIVRHAGRILALMEGAKPIEMTPDLATLGTFDFGGALKGAMTAHPKQDPVTGELVFFGYSAFAPHLRVHSATADGTLAWSTEVELLGPVMMHDFVITATRVLIFDLPAVLDIDALIAGAPGITWQPERGARIGVLDRGAPGGTIQWIDVDPFWVFHFLNAHDVQGETMEVIGCRTPRLNTSFDAEGLDQAYRPHLHRWLIDPVAGTVTDAPLDDRPTDFPRINEQRVGLSQRFGYSGHTASWSADEVVFDGVIKFDFVSDTSTTHRFGPSVVCGETVFTPDPARTTEDGGWLLNYVHNSADERSSVVVLDAETLDQLARVDLPRRVPFGFHGSFLPEPD